MTSVCVCAFFSYAARAMIDLGMQVQMTHKPSNNFEGESKS